MWDTKQSKEKELTFRIHAPVPLFPLRQPGYEHGGVNVAGLHASKAAHIRTGNR